MLCNIVVLLSIFFLVTTLIESLDIRLFSSIVDQVAMCDIGTVYSNIRQTKKFMKYSHYRNFMFYND